MKITHLLDRPIAFHRCFVSMTGSVKAAIMLSQAVYWQPRAKQADGWWYKTAEEWQEETGLSQHEQRTARKDCEKYLLSDLRGIPAQLFWKVDEDALYSDLIGGNAQTSLAESAKLDVEEARNINKNTETTTETTATDKQTSKPTARIDRTEAEQKELDIKKEAWLFPVNQAEIAETVFAKEAVDNFESCLHFNPLPWSSNREWEKFDKFVVEEYRKDKTVWQRYDEWRKDKGKYVGALSNKAIKYRPADFIACFPDFLAHTAMYGKSTQSREIKTDSAGAPITF